MAKIEIKSMGFGSSTCDGPMHISQKGGELRVTGISIHPWLPEVIGSAIRVTVRPDKSGPVLIEDPQTHKETAVDGEAEFTATDVIVEGEN